MSQGSIEQQYHQQLDALMMMIEDCIDELPQDVDVDGANGQLTLTFPDGSQIVISRQPSNKKFGWRLNRAAFIFVSSKISGFAR